MDERGGIFSVQIKYSVMHPGTHVWPHTGPTNCRLRMHLGLVIPKEGCKIRCANETKYVSPSPAPSFSLLVTTSEDGCLSQRSSVWLDYFSSSVAEVAWVGV